MKMPLPCEAGRPERSYAGSVDEGWSARTPLTSSPKETLHPALHSPAMSPTMARTRKTQLREDVDTGI